MSLKKYTYEVKHEEKDNYQSKNHCNGKHTEIGDRKMRGKHFLKTHSLTGCLFPERILTEGLDEEHWERVCLSVTFFTFFVTSRNGN
jgi:hypothetical protein